MDHDELQIDRYLAGECTPEEATAVEALLARDPTLRAVVDSARSEMEPAQPWDVDAAWAKTRVKAGLSTTAAPFRRSRRAAWRPSVLLRAAAIAAVAAGSVLAARTLMQTGEAGVGGGALFAATLRSESDTVHLTDGSTVILAADSRLEYPETFASDARSVRLTGEAYFDVARDASRPFTVHASNALIRVVGTAFVVRARGSAGPAEGTTVAVVEGAVAVRGVGAASSAEAMLRPGDVAWVAENGATIVTAAVDLDRWLGWLDGRLVFEDAPLRQVLSELERWYALEFRVADDELASRRVTARLRAGSLEETIEALTLALNARHTRAGDTITFLDAGR